MVSLPPGGLGLVVGDLSEIFSQWSRVVSWELQIQQLLPLHALLYLASLNLSPCPLLLHASSSSSLSCKPRLSIAIQQSSQKHINNSIKQYYIIIMFYLLSYRFFHTDEKMNSAVLCTFSLKKRHPQIAKKRKYCKCLFYAATFVQKSFFQSQSQIWLSLTGSLLDLLTFHSLLSHVQVPNIFSLWPGEE